MFFNYGPGALLGNDTRLYDLAADPGQNSPLKDSAQEPRMEARMTRPMAANKAPPISAAAKRRRPVCTISPRRCAAVSKPGVADNGLRIAFTFRTDTLPYLQIWHDFRPYAGVPGVEPCTSAKTGGVGEDHATRSDSPV
jgi:hypothetical protein